MVLLFLLPCLCLSFRFLSRVLLEVRKSDCKRCHCWALVTKHYNIKAQWCQICQMFVVDHATNENSWLFCIARPMRNRVLIFLNVLTFIDRLCGLAILFRLEVTTFFSLSHFFSIVMRSGVLPAARPMHCLAQVSVMKKEGWLWAQFHSSSSWYSTSPVPWNLMEDIAV